MLEVKHPLVQHKLSLMRNKTTNVKSFRELSLEISYLLAYEAMRNLPTVDMSIETPLEKGDFSLLKHKISLIAILRAGLIMTEAVSGLVPQALIGHIGVKRNEETLQPIDYYSNLPLNVSQTEVFLFDPMLATGGSAFYALDVLQKAGVKQVNLICIVAAPKGIEKIKSHPLTTNLTVASIDRELNEKGYIMPGLGDAGDRIFGTQ